MIFFSTFYNVQCLLSTVFCRNLNVFQPCSFLNFSPNGDEITNKCFCVKALLQGHTNEMKPNHYLKVIVLF